MKKIDKRFLHTLTNNIHNLIDEIDDNNPGITNGDIGECLHRKGLLTVEGKFWGKHNVKALRKMAQTNAFIDFEVEWLGKKEPISIQEAKAKNEENDKKRSEFLSALHPRTDKQKNKDRSSDHNGSLSIGELSKELRDIPYVEKKLQIKQPPCAKTNREIMDFYATKWVDTFGTLDGLPWKEFYTDD